ncbi:MAG: hypothetical protein WA951_01120, partial [Leeuwenhoekiella sp.]
SAPFGKIGLVKVFCWPKTGVKNKKQKLTTIDLTLNMLKILFILFLSVPLPYQVGLGLFVFIFRIKRFDRIMANIIY